jgi:hypothetical protein
MFAGRVVRWRETGEAWVVLATRKWRVLGMVSEGMWVRGQCMKNVVILSGAWNIG